MTNTMRYLSRILTIALLTIAMPSFGQQKFVFENIALANAEDSIYVIEIEYDGIEELSNVIKIRNIRTKFLMTFLCEDYAFYDKSLEYYSVLYEETVHFYPYRIELKDDRLCIPFIPINREAYNREYNRMRQALPKRTAPYFGIP